MPGDMSMAGIHVEDRWAGQGCWTGTILGEESREEGLSRVHAGSDSEESGVHAGSDSAESGTEAQMDEDGARPQTPKGCPPACTGSSSQGDPEAGHVQGQSTEHAEGPQSWLTGRGGT